MLTFAAAIFFLIISPGPGVLTTAGVGAAYGYRAGLEYVTGLGLGNNLVSLAVVSGLAALILAIPGIGQALLFLSISYLGYLALKIALAGSKIGFAKATRPPRLIDGLLLQFVNPKAYVVATTLFSGFRFMPETPVAEIALKFLIFNAIWIPIHLAWLWAGVLLNQMNLKPKVQRMINFGMAFSLVAVVALALLSPR